MARASVALVGLSLLLAQAAFAYDGPCGFATSGAEYTPSVSKEILVGGFPATETLAVVNGNFVVTITFDGFVPTPEKTYIQLFYFEEQPNVTALFDGTGTRGNGNKCDPSLDGLFYFTKWGNSQAISTLPAGSSVIYNGLTSVTITTPIYTSSLPFWYIKPSAICGHIKKTPSSLIVRIYDADTLNRKAPDGQCNDALPQINGVLDFTFTCSCTTLAQPPPSPNQNPGSSLPGTPRAQSPPPAPPGAPPCAVAGLDDITVSAVSKPLAVNGEAQGAIVSLAVQQLQNDYFFVITLDFGPGSFVPTTNTIIQYYFFEEADNYTQWQNNKGLNCSPLHDGLYFFLRWGDATNPTLPSGTVATYNGKTVTITEPLRSDKTPWWGLHVPVDSFCLHNKPGGARLATRVYEATTVATDNSTQPGCVEDINAVDSLLPFSFVCSCPPPPGQGGGNTPPPDRALQSPPPAPAFLPPCGINGSDGVITDTLYGTAPIAEMGDVAVSLKLDGANFVITVDFGPSGYIPIFGSTVFQYYYFESAAEAKDWIDSGNATKCNPGSDNLFFYIKWGSATAPTAPDGTTISYTATTATITQPIITDKVPFLGGDNTINNVCLHNKEGGVRLAYRIYTKQGVEDTDANYPGAFPNCAGLLSGGPANQIAFTWNCVCPPNEGGGAPPPGRGLAPPPGVCPTPSSPPCQFNTPDGPSLTAAQTFPLIGGGSVNVTVGLSGLYSPAPAFTIAIDYDGFTPTPGLTRIKYKFFEGYNTPVNQPPGFTGGFNVQLADKGSNCDPKDDSLFYTFLEGRNNVSGYNVKPAPVVTYTATGIKFLAPMKDTSFGAWNLDADKLKSICCHQKDGGTVLGIRIFNGDGSTSKAPCPEDLLALAVGNFNFQLDCTCPVPARKLLQTA